MGKRQGNDDLEVIVPRAIWKASIQFGPVSVPVKLYPAVKDVRSHSHLLHDQDRQRLQQRMVCSEEDAVVDRDETVKGYEVGPDRYVVVTDEEYQALEPRRSQTIEIDSFVSLDEIDRAYFDRPYYLIPREGGERSYRLLTEVMQETHKAGLAKFVLHDREHPVILWTQSQLLVVMMLHFHEEMVDRDEIKPGQAKLQPAKVKAITAAMENLKGKYDPAGYVDEQQQHITEFLRDKAEQQGTVLAAAPEEEQEQPAGEEGQDLVSALEESLVRTRKK